MCIKNQSLLYFAYGEHMNEHEMLHAFPHARMVGITRLKGYRLCFVGRDGHARAALEPCPGSHLPGRIWSLLATDAEALDRTADIPYFARREIREITIDGMSLPVLLYMTVAGQPYGRPGFVTYDIMREAYDRAGEDIDALRALAMQCAP